MTHNPNGFFYNSNPGKSKDIFMVWLYLLLVCLFITPRFLLSKSDGSVIENISDKSWINWQKLNKLKYLGLMTASSIASSVVSHPLHVLTMRQQTGINLASKAGIKGVLVSLTQAAKDVGFQGLFRGWIPLALGTTSTSLIAY